jgi:hypothetical protein
MGLLALAGCGGSSSGNNFQQQSSVTITGSPPSTIGVGANWQYAAAVSGATSQAVAWSVSSGGGTIDASTGLYIAPLAIPSPAKVTITATSQANPSQSASTSVTVQATDPKGTVSAVITLPSCSGNLQGATCFQMTVSCPGVADITAFLKVNNPNAAPVGTVLFGVGTGGSGLYDDPNAGGFMMGSTTVQNVLAGNFNTVQVSFGAPFTTSQPNGWLQGPGGVRRLACRYATIADWVYNNPKTINSNPNNTAANSAPMCATANSGGSGALAYAVYEYGLDTEFAMIEPTSGPPMTRLDQGCSPCNSNVQGPVCAGSMNQANLCYESADAGIIDEAYQSAGASTPTLCTSGLNGNSTPAGLFLSDSILYSGNISLPHTTVKMLFGDMDTSNAVPQGMIWGQSVSPNAAFQCIADAGHPIPDVTDGAMQIATDIQQNCH